MTVSFVENSFNIVFKIFTMKRYTLIQSVLPTKFQSWKEHLGITKILLLKIRKLKARKINWCRQGYLAIKQHSLHSVQCSLKKVSGFPITTVI